MNTNEYEYKWFIEKLFSNFPSYYSFTTRRSFRRRTCRFKSSLLAHISHISILCLSVCLSIRISVIFTLYFFLSVCLYNHLTRQLRYIFLLMRSILKAQRASDLPKTVRARIRNNKKVCLSICQSDS